MRAYRIFLELGGDELKSAFKELFESIDELSGGEQREKIRGGLFRTAPGSYA